MSPLEKIKQLLIGKIAFPGVNYLLNRKGISGQYKKLLAAEHLSSDAIRELQIQKLGSVLRHAYANCPYYARRFREVGLVPSDIKSLEDFRRVPPLERSDVIANRLELVDGRYRESALAADRAGVAPGIPSAFARFRKHRLVRNTTAGSTATPMQFYEDGSTSALSWVHEQRLKAWYALAPGVKEARMKLNPRLHGATPLHVSLREALWNQIMLPGFFLSDAEYDFCLRKIRKFRPRVLWGPTPALVGLARYAQRAHLDFSGDYLNLAISWAAPIYEHEKNLIGSVFQSSVSNIYGSRELGHVALMCPYGSLHVNQENYLVEIDTAGAAENGASRGELLITPLFDMPMPFIRYRIGDVAELGENDCPCGRSLLVVKNILGRIGEVFHTTDGYLVLPNFWCHVFTNERISRDVERFQVVYRTADCIHFRVVAKRGYSGETEAYLREFLKASFPPGTRFEFECVSDILPQPSGKTPFVVNEVGNREEHLTPL